MSVSREQLYRNVGGEFVTESRRLLAEEYVPKIERSLEKLTDEQIWWRPNEKSNSIGNLILHICGNARQWLVCGLGGARDDRERDTEFAERRILPRAELLDHLRKLSTDVDATLKDFDTSRLLNEFRIQGSNTTALAAILHVTEHFSMHTGQIIMLTKMLAEIDLEFYSFAEGQPVHTWLRNETEV